MGYITIALSPDVKSNYLTFSKNYRIFKTDTVVSDISKIDNIADTISIGSNDLTKLKKYFSYSKDGDTWSFWYEYSSGNLDMIKAIDLSSSELFFSFKYEYDDGTYDKLIDNVTIDEIQLRYTYIEQAAPLDLKPYVGQLACGDEFCPASVINRDFGFNPYDTGNMVSIYKEMSYTANQMWGLPVVYFRTVPEVHDGDYIFREWNLYNVVDRKCMKVVVNNNEFVDNKLYYNEFGIDFETPFEVHIDNGYFKSIFNQDADPRKKDFLYFPMLNRMFEIQGSYLFRGFMMTPVYWRVQLVKYTPNINYIMKAEDTKFLDNLLIDSEEAFGKLIARDTADALQKEQFTTISEKFDETRRSLSSKLKIEESRVYFNYAQFIHYNYNLSRYTAVEPAIEYNAKCIFGPTMPDLTYSCLFNVQAGATTVEFINAYTETSPVTTGIKIDGTYNSTLKKLTVKLTINDNVYSQVISNVLVDQWNALIVTASSTYNQVGIFVYNAVWDTNDELNYSEFVLLGSKTFDLIKDTVDSDLNYSIHGSNLKICNIRMFNRIISTDDHNYIMQQLFIKDESMLYFIDNCRPRLNAPFVMKKL